MKNIIIGLLFIFSITLFANKKIQIAVFFKEKKPSQKVLEKIKPKLTEVSNLYTVTYYNIEDKNNSEIISKIGLPETHFPFAVVINGKYSAKIDEKIISFVHFPIFMKGIGRHEGNWSLADLDKVLKDNSLLTNKNYLPIIDEKNQKTNCEE